MTWMNHSSQMKAAVQNAIRTKVLSGNRLLLREDIYDGDQIHIYEPLMGSQTVMSAGTILKDSLSNDLATILGEGNIVIVEFNVIGIAPYNTGELTRG